MKTVFDYCLVELVKTAESVSTAPPVKKKNPHVEAAKVVGSGIAGLVAGQLVGVGAGKAIEYFTGRKGGNPADMARKIAPIAGAASGIIYPIWQSQQEKARKNAVESALNQSDGRPPGQ